MSPVEFEFDMEKAVEVILYIANRIQRPTIRDVLKLVYLADKTSLESYGRFITGDRYVAMRQGPVPSKTYDLVKEARDSGSFGFVVEGKYDLRPLRDADMDELSESDITCLEQVINAFGHLPSWALRDETHDDAWEAVWQQATAGSVPIPVEKIVELFEESEELLDYLRNANDD